MQRERERQRQREGITQLPTTIQFWTRKKSSMNAVYFKVQSLLFYFFFSFLFILTYGGSIYVNANTETHDNNAAHLAPFQLIVIHISKIDLTTTQTRASLKNFFTNFLTHIVELLDRDCVRFSTF